MVRLVPLLGNTNGLLEVSLTQRRGPGARQSPSWDEGQGKRQDGCDNPVVTWRRIAYNLASFTLLVSLRETHVASHCSEDYRRRRLCASASAHQRGLGKAGGQIGRASCRERGWISWVE